MNCRVPAVNEVNSYLKSRGGRACPGEEILGLHRQNQNLRTTEPTRLQNITEDTQILLILQNICSKDWITQNQINPPEELLFVVSSQNLRVGSDEETSCGCFCDVTHEASEH